MQQNIIDEISSFVSSSPLNRFPDRVEPYFTTPLVGFVAAADQLFIDYQQLIGPFHQTPQQVLASVYGNEARAASVICWVLPITLPTRVSNRQEERFPSRAWAETRNFGEQLNGALRKHLVAWLTRQGHQAVAPQLAPGWHELADTPVGIASSWSERHAAYAAGLGTFSLNDGLITPAGIAHRLGSVITDLPLDPTPRPWPDHRHNCLYFREQSCGRCVSRCPAGALSFFGHDKKRCREYVYNVCPGQVAAQYEVTQTGCGLCQTRVPCEAQIPGSLKNGRGKS